MMKRIAIVMCGLLPVAALAQPVLTYRTHGLLPGDVNVMQQISYVAPGEAGAALVWDYSRITPVAAGRSEQLAAGADGKVLATSADGALFTYSCNEYANVFEGYQAQGRTVVFRQPVTKIRYPFTYGDALTGSFSGLVFHGSNNSNGGSMAGNYSSEADAYGTLLLPGNIKLNNVLRVKTLESYVEELCGKTQIEVVKYLWYAADYRYPVIVTWNITYTYEDGRTLTHNESHFTAAALTSTPETPVAVPAVAENDAAADRTTPPVTPDITYSVYPNPYNSYFHLTYSLEQETLVDIALFTASGRYVQHLVKNTRQNGVQHITYNPQSSDLSGFYFLRMTFNEKVYVQALVRE